jgi:hypothetical protein
MAIHRKIFMFFNFLKQQVLNLPQRHWRSGVLPAFGSTPSSIG